MSTELNATHDPSARSFVESANAPGCDFPIQNLPLGAFTNGQNVSSTLCVAIGDQAFNLQAASERLLLGDVDEATCECCKDSCLNALMGLGPARWTVLRRTLFNLLSANSNRRAEVQGCLHAIKDVSLVMPVSVGNYTDFYASIHHASNVGALFRPENPLLPNYKWVPIGYHGRASSVVITGTEIRRPWGQLKSASAEQPTFAPCRRLDYEVEIGAFAGVGNEMGEPIPIAQARDHIFGFCLVNDWSARDIQSWEYQPLGPFLAKSFATTISPWIVTTEALAPYRVAASVRAPEDPKPLPYLVDPKDEQCGAFDVSVEVYLRTAAIKQAHFAPLCLSRGKLRDMYWTFAQLFAHHTSNGCDLRPGDLLASGTISGPNPENRGCLLESTKGGAAPIRLPDGTQRTFLEDGDEIILKAFCENSHAARIGFGECRGTIIAAR